ncbi:MAG TPA: L-threonine 3-dehydrogenase [Terriglobales bacterium]|nr:L-threonine 3-dehydrogenase [Terriglobales bacterium]
MSTSKTMQAVVKPEPRAGAEIREVPIPKFGDNDVFIRVKVAAVCGTDLHIYDWDPWAQGRIKTPLVPGHEFCGDVAAVGKNVTSVKEGDFVSAEMHVACGKCYQCRIGEAHICQKVTIIGIDSDGAFAEYVVIPESNIWKIDPKIPADYAAILDPLGNAVHTVLSGEIAAQSIAIIGCGPIGLFAIAVARAVGASTIFAIEPNENRRRLAKEMKADYVLDPTKDDLKAVIQEATNGAGVDVVAEMSGNGNAIRSGFDILRMGGRISLLGTPTKPVELNLADAIIFKGATVHGIHGRRMYKTWYQMQELLKHGRLDLGPAITDRIAMKDFDKGMERLKTGAASKILLYPNGVK